MNNKTFADLQKGDKIYFVVTDLPKLSVSEQEIIKVEPVSNVAIKLFYKTENGKEAYQAVYTEDYRKEKARTYSRYIYCHTNMEAAKQTIKETIQYRIKKKQQIIRESQRAIENYKQELKKYEEDR